MLCLLAEVCLQDSAVLQPLCLVCWLDLFEVLQFVNSGQVLEFETGFAEFLQALNLAEFCFVLHLNFVEVCLVGLAESLQRFVPLCLVLHLTVVCLLGFAAVLLNCLLAACFVAFGFVVACLVHFGVAAAVLRLFVVA